MSETKTPAPSPAVGNPTASRTGLRRFVTVKALGGVLAIVVLVAAGFSTTVVKISDKPVENAFNASDYADSNFDSVVVPKIFDMAVPFTDLVTAIAADEPAAKVKYGNSSNPNNAYSYAVTFTAVAGDVNGAAIPLKVDGLPADLAVTMQISELKGSAVRDVTGTVDLNDFLNQVEYLHVALEFNKRVQASVIDPFLALHPAATLSGQTLKITGVFTRSTATAAAIVPLKIEVVS